MDLFPDWRPEEIDELFACPLFEHKGRVAAKDLGFEVDLATAAIGTQLRPGQLPSYLAASWLSLVFATTGLEDDVTSSLVTIPPGHDRPWVAGGRRLLAGWAAVLSSGLRKPVLRACPALGLSHADPAELSHRELEQLITQFLARPESRLLGLSVARRKKIARPSLEPRIAAALGRPLPLCTKWDLLKLAKTGKYATAVEPALAIALDREQNEQLRQGAIELVGRVGSSIDKQTLLQLVTDDDSQIRRGLYGTLVPDVLSGASLIDFLSSEVTGEIVYEFRSKPLSLTVDECLSLSRKLNGKFSAKHESQGTVDLGLHLLLLQTVVDEALPPEFITLLDHIEKERHEYHISYDVRDALKERFVRPRIWESIWSARLATDSYPESKGLCPIVPERLHWLLDRVEDTFGKTQLPLANFLASNYLSGLQADSLATVRQLTDNRYALELLHRVEADHVGRANAQDDIEGKKQQKQARLATKNSAAIREDRSRIAKGEHPGALQWAYARIHESTGAETSAAKLHGHVDDELIPDILEGFVHWWPNCNARLPGLGSRTHGELWGLVGVALDVERRGTKDFSAAEVRTATLLGLSQINTVPDWFGELYSTHQASVSVELREAIFHLWCEPTEHTTLLARLARFNVTAVRGQACECVYDALESDANDSTSLGSPQVLLDATSLMLATGNSPWWVAAHCADVIGYQAEQKWRQAWLRLWSHLAPVDAALWVSEARQNDQTWDEALLHVCERFSWDFDHGQKTTSSRFWEPESLELWIPLLNDIAPPKTPRHRSARAVAIAWGPQEHARNLLEACQRRLVSSGHVRNSLAIAALTQHTDPTIREWAKEAIDEQLDAAATESVKRWSVEGILSAERYRVQVPLTAAELQRVVVSDLRKVNARLCDGDFSYVELIKRDLTEAPVQRWIASELGLVGSHSYTVVRESEVKDNKRIDIAAFRPSVGRVPIEIKPLSKETHSRSLASLRGTIEKQLLGLYMRPADVTHGVLLVVRLDDKSWDGHTLEEGLRLLREFADSLLESHGKTIAVEVIDVEAARKRVGKVAKRRREGGGARSSAASPRTLTARPNSRRA